jgi:hypothetical protein
VALTVATVTMAVMTAAMVAAITMAESFEKKGWGDNNIGKQFSQKCN